MNYRITDIKALWDAAPDWVDVQKLINGNFELVPDHVKILAHIEFVIRGNGDCFLPGLEVTE